MLQNRAEQAVEKEEPKQQRGQQADDGSFLEELIKGPRGSGGRRREGLAEALAKSAARAVGNSFGRSLLRGILGSLRIK